MKVSIILTSYNHEKYIAESIDSVLNQTYSDFELLICDDGSFDNSQAVIKSYDDSRIKLFLYEKNLGPTRVAQEALAAAQGEYIAIHHSDDIWEASKLEKQVNFMETHSEYAACFTQVKFIDELGEFYDLPDNHHYKNVFKQRNRTREEWLNHLFWKMNCFCNPSVLVRNDKSFIAQNPCLYQLPDYFMWLKLLMKRNIYVLEEELIRFRLRRYAQDSMSSWSVSAVVRTTNETYFLAKEFLPLLDDAETFLRVFPEAEEYRVDGKIVLEYAFAQLYFKHPSPGYRQMGLELLYNLLRDPIQADEIKELYDYDEKKFVADTGFYDIFAVKSQLKSMHTCLYYDCGDGLNERDCIHSDVIVQPDGEFIVKFVCHLEKPVKLLRFDPDRHGTMALKLTQILINGETITDYSSNALEVVDGYHEFLGPDPNFFIEHEIVGAKLEVQITGIFNDASAEAFGNVLLKCVNTHNWQMIKSLKSQDWQLLESLYSHNWQLIKSLDSHDWRLLKSFKNFMETKTLAGFKEVVNIVKERI